MSVRTNGSPVHALKLAIDASIFSARDGQGRELPLTNPAWARCMAILNGETVYCTRCHRPAFWASAGDVGKVCGLCRKGRLVPGEGLIRLHGIDALADTYCSNAAYCSLDKWECIGCGHVEDREPEGDNCPRCKDVMKWIDGRHLEPA